MTDPFICTTIKRSCSAAEIIDHAQELILNAEELSRNSGKPLVSSGSATVTTTANSSGLHARLDVSGDTSLSPQTVDHLKSLLNAPLTQGDSDQMLAKAQATIGKTESGMVLRTDGELNSISHLTSGQPDSGNHPYSKIDQLEDTGPGTGAESDVL